MGDLISEPFDPSIILSTLAEKGFDWIRATEYFESIDSTNDYLLGMEHSIHGRVCIADFQTRGKGRRGRQWHASKGANLMFSLGWGPQGTLQSETSLIVGVALADALVAAGLEGVGLKWPNDVLVDGRKLAGVLVETRLRGRQAEAVIGVGLNLYHQSEDMQNVERPWTDLAQLGLEAVDRQQLLISVLSHLARRLAQFEQSGFGPVREDWLEYHVFNGSDMSYQHHGQVCTGRVVGLDDRGALLFQTEGGLVPVHSGEVSKLTEMK